MKNVSAPVLDSAAIVELNAVELLAVAGGQSAPAEAQKNLKALDGNPAI